MKMKQNNISSQFVCQIFHECYELVGGSWRTEKIVDTKEEAFAWVKEASPYEDRRFYEIRTPLLKIIEQQLSCVKNNRQPSLPKEILIDSYKEVIKMLSNDWRLYDESEENLPARNTPILLLIRKPTGRLIFKAAIFDEWEPDLFVKNTVLAWKYIEMPKFVSTNDFSEAYPVSLLYETQFGIEPGCELGD